MLPARSDFLVVMRGHGGVTLRGIVKRSLEVHRWALLSDGTGNVVCSTMSWWVTTSENICLSSRSFWLCTLGVAFDVIFVMYCYSEHLVLFCD